MKQIIMIVTALFLASCGNNKKDASLEDVIASNDLAKIRAYKNTLDEQQLELSKKIKQLNAKISELDTSKKVPLVSSLTVKEDHFEHYLELQGNVQTKKNVLIYPETPGQITRIHVREGQSVAKGQVLAQIDAGGLGSQLAQAEASANLAKTTFERQERLWNQKIGSEIQYLQAQTNYEAQTNTVNQLKKTLAKYTIRAPFSGIIDEVFKEQGTVVAPGIGSEVFRIVNLSDMYIETDVPETYINTVKKGKEVKVTLPVLDKTINSKIRQAGRFINPANRTFKVQVHVPNKDKTIKPNLTAKLQINDYTNPRALLIPQNVISENASGEQYVYVITNIKDNTGIAKRAIIKTGRTQGDVVEVLEGLSNSAQIIKEGARSVQEGQEVKIISTK